MYLYGSVIAVVTHFSNVEPRAAWDAGVAQAAFKVFRLGPTVPVVPAAASVWHEPQPPTPVKISFPLAAVGATFAATARARAPVSCPGSAATVATKAAMSWASWPFTS